MNANTNKYDIILIVLLIILSPLFLFPFNDFVWLVLIIPIIWSIRAMKCNHIHTNTILDWSFLILCIQVFISIINNFSTIYSSLAKAYGVLFGLITFYAVVNLVKSEKLLSLSISIFIFLGSLFSILAFLGTHLILERFLHVEFPQYKFIYRFLREATPILDFKIKGAEMGFHPNAVAGTLLFFSPIFLLMVEFHKAKKLFILKNKIFFYVFFWCTNLLIFIILISSTSLLALFGLIISLIIIILIQNRKKTIKYVLVVSIIIALSILILNPSPSLKNDFERKWQKRSPLLLKGIEIIREKPFTGVGLNRFRYSSGVEYYSAHAHNHLIHIAAELGIQALIAYLAIMISTGYMCLKVYWNSDVEWMRTAILGLGGGQLAHFFFGLGDSIPLGAKPGIIFWISLALITAIYNYHVQIDSSR